MYHVKEKKATVEKNGKHFLAPVAFGSKKWQKHCLCLFVYVKERERKNVKNTGNSERKKYYSAAALELRRGVGKWDKKS